MTDKPPLQHRVIIDKPYTRSISTNVAETIQKERDRLAQLRISPRIVHLGRLVR